MHIIGLTGYAQSGKDTVANYLVKTHGFTRIAFADPMREAMLKLNPIVYVPFMLKDRSYVVHMSLRLESSRDTRYVEDGVYARLADIVRVLGWDIAKQAPQVRELLQRFGTEVGREMFGENVWVNKTFDTIEQSPAGRWVITDVRFENEAVRTHLHDGHVVLVDRGLKPVNDHKSDSGLERKYLHGILHNRGTIGELHEGIDAMLEHFGVLEVRQFEEVNY